MPVRIRRARQGIKTGGRMSRPGHVILRGAVLGVMVAAAARGGELGGGLLPLLNLTDVQPEAAHSRGRLGLWRTGLERGLSISLRGEDLYRRYVGGVRVAGLSARSAWVALSLPGVVGQAAHETQIRIAGSSTDLEGRSRGPGWSGGLDVEGSAYQLCHAISQGRHRAAVSMSWSRSSAPDQEVRLDRFHRSESDARMNRYFWDLLEPTVGDRIHLSAEDRRRGIAAGWLVSLSARDQVALTARFHDRRPESGVRYLNTGSRAELRGWRRAQVQQEEEQSRAGLAYQRRMGGSWWARGELDLVDHQLRARVTQLEVPESTRGIVLDVVELGVGDASRRGVELKLRTGGRRRRLDLETAMFGGKSSYEAQGEGSTPVLGFSLRTVPITHRGDAELSGTIHTWGAAIQAERRWTQVRLRGGAFTARADLEAQSSADAAMEFGLYVHPLRDLSRYRIATHRVFAASSVQITEQLRVEYQVTQYFITIDGGDLEKPELQQDVRVRGGTVHTATLTCPF